MSKAGLVLKGLTGSGGVTVGRARVVRTGERFELDREHILVCAHTDPAWVPLYRLAGGLVVDHGGIDGLIVARELGLPCVFGTPDAVGRIRTGQLLRVDGGGATVEVLS